MRSVEEADFELRNDTIPKYARVECAHLFLINTNGDWRTRITAYSKQITNLYLPCGRLKLTKKYEFYSARSQPIVSVWLSSAGHEALASVTTPDYAFAKSQTTVLPGLISLRGPAALNWPTPLRENAYSARRLRTIWSRLA